MQPYIISTSPAESSYSLNVCNLKLTHQPSRKQKSLPNLVKYKPSRKQSESAEVPPGGSGVSSSELPSGQVVGSGTSGDPSPAQIDQGARRRTTGTRDHRDCSLRYRRIVRLVRYAYGKVRFARFVAASRPR